MPNFSVLVSVLLPVYNGEKYIRESVDSILKQTYENFELIIIDDGSTDKTLSILKEYEKIDARVRLVSRQNKGLIATLNEGAELALGQWVARMDADDVAIPNRLERQLNWINQTGADVAGSWVRFFGAKDFRIWKGYITDEAIKVDMLFKCPMVHPSIIIRASLLKQLKYDPVAEKAEDYDLWVRATMQGIKMTNLPEVLLKYRQHSLQVTTVFRKSQEEMTKKIQKKYWEFFLSIEKKDSSNLPFTYEVVNLNTSKTSKANIESATQFYLQLASQCDKEAKLALLNNIFQLSLNSSKARYVWRKINDKYGEKPELFKKLILIVWTVIPNILKGKALSVSKYIYFTCSRK